MKYMDGWMALGGAFFFLRDYIRRPSSLCALRAHFINHSARARAAWKIKSQNWDVGFFSLKGTEQSKNEN